jgi:hypothetical protein
MNDTQTDPDVVSDSDLFRIIAFILLITMFNLWCVRHLGWGTTNPGIVGLLLAGPAVAIKTLEWMGVLNRNRKLWIGERVRPIFLIVLSTRWLSIGYFGLLVLGFMYSSIMIVPGPADSEKEYSVVSTTDPDDVVEKRFGSSNKASLARVFISPFGSTFNVVVDGYLEKMVTVYPLVGRTLNAEVDLIKIPTVYIRPSVKALKSLKRKSHLVLSLSHVSEPTAPPISVELQGRNSAYLIGEERQVPGYLPALWREELVASGSTNNKDIATTMQAWRNYVRVSPGLMTTPVEMHIRTGTILRVDVVTPGGCSIAGGHIQIRKRIFVDLKLQTWPKAICSNAL